jgi:wyosine [tRNA(Phe)-imidazoG37] synthetase (radical SAM superfamily)
VLVTETMLVAGLNDAEDEVAATAEVVSELAPRTAYLAIPTRPPAEPWVEPPTDAVVARAYALMAARLPRVELLADYPEPDVGFAHNLESELCAIAAVHPLRRSEVERLVEKAHAHFTDVERMIDHGELSRVEYRGQEFYVRHVVPRAARA